MKSHLKICLFSQISVYSLWHVCSSRLEMYAYPKSHWNHMKSEYFWRFLTIWTEYLLNAGNEIELLHKILTTDC